MDRIEEIIHELEQICTQYKAEVPSNRRAWPESVKKRVFELRDLGLSFGAIAKKTGLCYQTIFSWKKSESFLPVKVVEQKKSPTVIVKEKPPKARRREIKSLTVTVITPSGFRIEGLDQKVALLLLEKM